MWARVNLLQGQTTTTHKLVVPPWNATPFDPLCCFRQSSPKLTIFSFNALISKTLHCAIRMRQARIYDRLSSPFSKAWSFADWLESSELTRNLTTRKDPCCRMRGGKRSTDVLKVFRTGVKMVPVWQSRVCLSVIECIQQEQKTFTGKQQHFHHQQSDTKTCLRDLISTPSLWLEKNSIRNFPLGGQS